MSRSKRFAQRTRKREKENLIAIERMGDEVIDFDFEGEEGEVKEEVLTKECFPMCIVWTWLPPISFLLPFVGHVGVTDSRGLIHDFIGMFFFDRPFFFFKVVPNLKNFKCFFL